MRFFIKLILGMVLFNAFIWILAPFFPNHALISSNAVNVTGNSTYTGYSNIGSSMDMIIRMFTSGEAVAIFSILSIGAVFASIVLGARNLPFFLGLGFFISFIATLYVGMMHIFTSLTDNPIVSGIITLMTICIGILLLFEIANALMARSDTG